MSITTSAVPAYQAAVRTSTASSQSSGIAPTAPVVQRETELARQLEARLNGEISRIRQQIHSGGSDSHASDNRGQRVDIRA